LTGKILVKKSAELIRPGRKIRREKFLPALSFIQSRRMSMDLDFFGLTEEVARPIAHSLSANRRGGDCWGWQRLVRVSVSSTNTCPPPKAAAYSASATDAATTGMLAEEIERSVVGDRQRAMEEGWMVLWGLG
jgi:hypothetical protein